MKIPLDELLRKSLRDAISAQTPKMTFAKFGEIMGHGRSWANKVLFSGPNATAYIERSELEKAEKLLNLQFITYGDPAPNVPEFMRELAASAAGNPALTSALSALHQLAKPEVHFTIPTLHQKTLTRLGAAITRIVYQWDEPRDPHYTKIGLEVVEEIRSALEELFPMRKQSR